MNDKNIGEHRLALAEVLEWMIEDGLVGKDVADSLKTERRLHGGKIHPLIVIADQNGEVHNHLSACSAWKS